MGMLSCGFMQRALLVGLLGGVACSVMGVLVIGMRLSFIGAVISHAAFAGGVIAMFAGYNPLVGAFVISLLAGAVIGPLCDKGEFNPDTSLGIVFAVMIGLAFLFMGLMPEAERLKAYSLIWGSILTVTNLDLKILMLTFALVLTLLLLFYKEIQAVIFNREIALAVGLPASWIFMPLIFNRHDRYSNFTAYRGLLVFSLIITPAATVYQLTHNLKHLFWLAMTFGVSSAG